MDNDWITFLVQQFEEQSRCATDDTVRANDHERAAYHRGRAKAWSEAASTLRRRLAAARHQEEARLAKVS